MFAGNKKEQVRQVTRSTRSHLQWANRVVMMGPFKEPLKGLEINFTPRFLSARPSVFPPLCPSVNTLFKGINAAHFRPDASPLCRGDKNFFNFTFARQQAPNPFCPATNLA